jgi:hypothetical protein
MGALVEVDHTTEVMTNKRYTAEMVSTSRREGD